jgi:hypothetical protein
VADPFVSHSSNARLAIMSCVISGSEDSAATAS